MIQDESFYHKHDALGMLGMVKREGLAHTSLNKFYVTTNSPLTHLDGKNVVFGRVISGMRIFLLIKKMHTHLEKPFKEIWITECGVYKF